MSLEAIQERIKKLQANVNKVIYGKEEPIRLALVGLLAKGHILIEDVPGVGKTTLAKAIAKSISATYKRIQFTPDLLPTDITGVSIYNQKTGDFAFHEGPVFTNILLADEINRATPRTQSALLECMDESQVTVDGKPHALPPLYFVIATQNPIEQQGTYPLPEAQLDRFMLRIRLGYAPADVEMAILEKQIAVHPIESLEPVTTVDEIRAIQNAVRQVHVSEAIRDYIVRIVAKTREHEDILLGASPRGSLSLMRGSQALALVEGQTFVSPHHPKRVAHAVLAHRLILTPQARLSGMTPEAIVEDLLSSVEVPTQQAAQKKA